MNMLHYYWQSNFCILWLFRARVNVQFIFNFSSVAQSCLTLCDPMNHMPGLPMLCYAKSLQSCPTLCDPIDGSPPGSPIPGILQARTLEWVAISFSNAWKWKGKVKSLSRVQLLATPCSLPGSSVHGIFQARVLEWGAIACPSPTPRVHSNSCPSSRWCHPAILSSVVPFSSCPQSFPASGSFQMSQFFTLGGQSIGVSASTSVLPRNTQDRSPLGWTGWISLQSKRLARVFSNTTVQKHQFFGAHFLYSPTLTSIHNYWKNHSLD